jgi:hypothetical protein
MLIYTTENETQVREMKRELNWIGFCFLKSLLLAFCRERLREFSK